MGYNRVVYNIILQRKRLYREKKMNWIEVKRTEAIFSKLFWSPGINSKEMIPPAYALAGRSQY